MDSKIITIYACLRWACEYSHLSSRLPRNFGSHVTVRPSVSQGNQWVFFTLCGAWMLIDVYYGRLGHPEKIATKLSLFFFDLLLMSTLTSITGKELEREIKKNDSTERQRTCWNAKKMLTFLLSVLTSDWLKQQKLTKLHKAVHIYSSLLSNHLPYNKIWSQFE